MPTYTRKITTVEARQHLVGTLPVSSSLKGDQICSPGDFLVVDPDALAVLRAAEIAADLPANSLPNKGAIYVISKAQFMHDFIVADETPAPVIVGDEALDFVSLAPAV